MNFRTAQFAMSQWLLLAVITVPLLVLAPGVSAKSRKKKEKPALTLKVRKGKKIIGTARLRVKSGEANQYFSTKSRLNDSGRRFTFRTHTVLDAKGNLVTYDRWIDVKGATLRRRVFSFKGAWKLVVFPAERGQKKQLTELKVKAPLVVLDPRSPILISLAVDRMAGKEGVAYVNAQTGETGALAITATHLTDANGKRFIRYRLKSSEFTLSVLRDDTGRTIAVAGLGRYGGGTTAFKPGALQPAPAGNGGSDAAPIAPPSAGQAKAPGTGADNAAAKKAPAAAAKPAPKK
ncbi:MAG: hypothetical protein KC502_05940 [Myxococcales bacterium]|nr:hypothetical protein [Myxococcales bacterium]